MTVVGLDALCLADLSARCEGWEDRLCPGASPTRIDATSCTERFDVLRINYPDECGTWLRGRCEGHVAAVAQATYEASDACPSETTREDGALGDSVSEPDRHDCPIYAYAPMPAALVAFDALPADRVAYQAAVDTWEGTDLGTAAVGSCEEYVEQRYYTYGAYRQYTESFYDDARRVMQLAFSTEAGLRDVAIGTRVETLGTPFGHYPLHAPALEDEGTQHSLDGGRGTNFAQKNDFYELFRNPGALAAFRNALSGGMTNPFDQMRNEAILARLATNQFVYERTLARGPNDGWRWHARMSRSLAEQGYGDEELAALHGLRTTFLQRLEERRGKERQLELARLLPGNPRIALIQVEIANLDTDLEQLLVQANGRGCFTLRTDSAGNPIPHPCDWSPEDFVEDVQESFEPRKEAELARCRRLAPADLTELAGGYPYVELVGGAAMFRNESEDARQAVWRLEQYLDRQEVTLANLDALR
ncbi:MAG: hypothetical protein H6721_00790 [Sandaracinus sp.]|nr:hypothetical protein [Sandaracinus sp.]MCB9623667.1 hypothetical protein [Sandaracinus sp.]MCB9630680.1 hypothetical protein [Sandaracinus sp.]